MAKKIDLSGAKEFLFNHGEKVALGTCAFLALLFGGLGLLRAFSAGNEEKSGKPWVEVLKAAQDQINQGMTMAQPPVIPAETNAKMNEEYYEWTFWNPKYDPSSYIPFGDPTLGNKRLNPQAFAIMRGDANIKVDFVRAPALVHEYEAGVLKTFADGGTAAAQPKGGLGEPKQGPKNALALVQAGKPIRTVVVTARFPMKLQVEEFRRALRLSSQKDLFDNRDDLPRPLGIDVVRFEVVNGQRVGKGETILGIDPETKQFVKSKALDDLLRYAIYDEKTPALLEPFLFEGLVTPLPKLAYGTWPAPVAIEGLDLAALEEPDTKKPGGMVGIGNPPKKEGLGPVLPGLGKGKDKDKDKKMPPDGEPKEAPPDRPTKDIDAKTLKKEHAALYDRLSKGTYNIYHSLGLEAPSKEKQSKVVSKYFKAWDIKLAIGDGDGENPPKKDGGVIGPDVGKGGNIGPDGGKGGQGGAITNWDRDALVRFIDPDVVPGKIYQYAVQVRLANPNYNKAVDLLTFANLAKIEQLESGWELTPVIPIPPEYHLYAVDQQYLDDLSAADPGKKIPLKLDVNQIRDKIPLQIHQWTAITTDFQGGRDLIIGDWTIAEKILVQRGEAIGKQVLVQVPTWIKEKDAFEVPLLMPDKKDKKAGMKPCLLMDMKPESERPVLVDFFGGKRLKGPTGGLEEETAVDVLILSADGKLTVLNSRIDSHPDAGNPIATERHERVISVRRRTDDVLGRTGTAPNSKGADPKLPGVKN